jgi:hypothetical protein
MNVNSGQVMNMNSVQVMNVNSVPGDEREFDQAAREDASPVERECSQTCTAGC